MICRGSSSRWFSGRAVLVVLAVLQKEIARGKTSCAVHRAVYRAVRFVVHGAVNGIVYGGTSFRKLRKTGFRTKNTLVCLEMTETRSFSNLKLAAAKLHRSKTGIFQRSLKCSLFTALGSRPKSSRFRHFQAECALFCAFFIKGYVKEKAKLKRWRPAHHSQNEAWGSRAVSGIAL